MQPKFKKNADYSESEVIDEIVLARLFQDYERLSGADDEDELRAAYKVVLRYLTVYTDKRLKMLDLF